MKTFGIVGIFLSTVVGIAACSGSSGSDGMGDAAPGVVDASANGMDPSMDTDAATGPDGGPEPEPEPDPDPEPEPPENSPPVILTLGTNTNLLFQDEILRISVVASDPDGIHELIGGVVRSPEGAYYGALQSDGSPGAYSLSLSWQELEAVEEIYGPAGGVERDFHVMLFDVLGAEALGEVTVTLACNDSEWGLCDGTCVDFDTDPENCGLCGFDCSQDFGTELSGNICVRGLFTSCYKTGTYYLDLLSTLSCSDYCDIVAGPQASISRVETCPLIAGNCEGSFCYTAPVDLPENCAHPYAVIECTCHAWYVSPGNGGVEW